MRIPAAYILAATGVQLALTSTLTSKVIAQDLERIHGLPHNSVFAIHQDSKGFLWIGTSDGLSRYDGYEFLTYRHDPADSTSLTDNSVRAIAEDVDGTLWVGTEAALEEHIGSGFIHHALAIRDSTAGASIPGIFAIHFTSDGRLLAGTPEGFHVYDPRSRARTVFRRPELAVPWYAVAPDSSGIVWLAGSEMPDVLQFDPGRGTFTPQPGQDSVTAGIAVGPTGTVWSSTGSGISYFDRTARAFVPLMPVGGGQHLLEDSAGRLWVGGAGGLTRIDPTTRQAEPVRLEGQETNALARRVQTIFEDRAGAIWIGTLGGLFRHDPYRKPFRVLQHDPRDVRSLGSNAVSAILEDDDGRLWVGTLGGGLNLVEGTLVRRIDPLCHDNVWALAEHRGDLWIGTDAGVCVIRRAPVHYRATAHGSSRDLLLRSEADDPETGYINVMAHGPDGRLWLGGATLTSVEPTGRRLRHAPGDDWNIQAIHPDTLIWFGTEFNGLWSYHESTGRMEAYPVSVADGSGLLGKAVRFIHHSRGALWLATDMGLVRFDPRTGHFRHYLQRDGLPGSQVYAILEDDHGRFWVSTNQNLALFHPESEIFQVFDRSDGTGNSEYNRRAAFQSHSGEFYFGGMDGLSSFRPNEMPTNPYIPPIVITRVEKATRDGRVEVLTEPMLRGGLVVEPGDHSFTLQFAALSFTSPSKNRFAHRLEGFEEEWVAPGDSRSARYAGLPPGRYTFRVIGSNDDGIWNEEGAALAVVVLPALWQTWWFRLATVALVLAMAAAAYRYRVRHLLEIERMRMRIAADLHDHVGTGLSSIALISDVVSEKPDALHREELGQIGRVARELVDGLRDIVWFINPEHDAPEDLLRKMRQLAVGTLSGAECRIELTAHLERYDMELRRDLFLIYKEAITNVARHAHAHAVHIRLWEDGNTVQMVIQDDGVGFNRHLATEGNGLRNMKRRAARLGGSLEVGSESGQGTTLRLRITRSRDGGRSIRSVS